MENYCQLMIRVTDTDMRDLLIAQLADIGYDAFEETDEALLAYITEKKFNAQDVNSLLAPGNLLHSTSIIEKQNWNALWESNFEPVQVHDFAGVRAAFHAPFTGVMHEIVITPKMSFGTGHHATTYLMMQLMRQTLFQNKTVFDFGTGTGILAILAEKLGSSSILAVDNDECCIENAAENISVNHCKHIDIQKVENGQVNKRFDIILANINKNIILDNLHFLLDGIVKDGEILLSGLLVEDEAGIVSCLYFHRVEAYGNSGAQRLDSLQVQGMMFTNRMLVYL